MAVDKFIKAHALQIVSEHVSVLEKATEEILKEIDSARVEGDTAFAYAKEQIRRQGIREGLTLLRQRITRYAEQS